MPTGPAPSLRELCLARNAELLLASCLSVEREYGTFSEPACVNLVEELQCYLLECYGNLMNDVCAKARELKSDLRDARILFAIELHRYTRSFVFVNDVMYANINRDTGFWASQLGKVTSVTVIDIRTILCTDAMINAISDNCHQLEEFRFMTHLFPIVSTDYQHVVTTRGLKRLLELANLRVVDDAFKFKNFPDNFLKMFFSQLLPRLENFYHENLKDFILDNLGDLESLQLTDVMIHDVRPKYVLAILRLCPRLKRLHLKQPYDGVFDDITNTPLNLGSFQVDRFSGDFVPGLCHYLLNKGDRLTSLVLRTDALVSVKEVILVGECCPNLQHLELKLQTRRATAPYSNNPVQTDIPIFGCLTSLSLNGRYNGNIDLRIAKLFVELDSNVTTLSLSEVWLLLLQRVQEALPLDRSGAMFPNLTALTIMMHPKVPLPTGSSALVKSLCCGCPKLTYLRLYTDVYQFDRRSDLWRRFFDGEEHLSRRNVRFDINGLHTGTQTMYDTS